ncbi:MAG: Peptidase S9 prolyl oligopeptidase active site protein [uncultured bacterium]|nr:MAG: Peptidase S9 prolyl oligopeptidase active site protein [uncultured bacterium]
MKKFKMSIKKTQIIMLSFVLFFIAQMVNAKENIKNYSAKNVLDFVRIAQVLPSPDSSEVAYVTYSVDASLQDKKWVYSLYIKNKLNQTKLIVRTEDIESINYSPDGTKIIYLAPGKKFQSIWIVDTNSNLKKKLYEFTQDISVFKISPNSQNIAFLANSEKTTPTINKPIDESKNYQNSQLYNVSITNVNLVKAITNADISVTDFDWSPDNKSLVFSYQPRDGAAYTNENKLSVLNLENGIIKRIPYTDKHTGVDPHYSPDGKWVAFATNLSPAKFAQPLNDNVDLNNQICIANTSSLETHCLSNTFDQNPSILGWNSNSENVLVLDAFKTIGYYIYALNINSSKPAKLLSNVEGFIEPFTISLNQSHTAFGLGYETVSNAPEAFTSSVEPFQLTQISHLNDTKKDLTLGNTKVIQWSSSDGKNIEGLLLTPKNYDANKKYPLYVAVHGGPSGIWQQRYLGGCDEYGTMIDPTTCWQNLLSLGFVVFQPNPRGSSGYGLSFRLANYADFGGGDYRDVMTGVDYLINKGIADPKHLAIGGWSFGGYMTAWAISQSNRFKAAVEGDGNTDFISFSGTSDLPTYYERYLGEPFWQNNKLYLERAPIMHVQNIQTPLLIMHGENDLRVPLSQSQELYTALERQHKSVKFIIFPKQHHVPTDANIIFDSIGEVDSWLAQAIT